MAIQVLVVDDDPMIRRIVSQLLQVRFGAMVSQANDGEAAWASLETRMPDLLVLDLSMPVMDGLAFLEKLRADPERSGLPVVALSATDERETIERVVALGAIEYILKPINLALASKRFGRVIESISHRRNVRA